MAADQQGAVKVLQDVDFHMLEPLEAAGMLHYMLALPHMIVQDKLFNTLQQKLTKEWVESAPLSELCIVMAVMYAWKKNSINGDVIARVMKRLIACEVSVGGPYKNTEGVVDPLINLSVAYLVFRFGKALPSVTLYLERFFASAEGETLQSKGYFIDELVQLLGLSSLKPISYSPDFLPLIPTSPYLEAVRLFGRQTVPIRPVSGGYDSIIRSVSANFELLDDSISTLASGILQRVRDADKSEEIGLIATIFAHSLYESRLPSAFLAKLGEANMYCWMAYTIFDHIIDQDSSPELLPVGAMAMRRAIAVYQSYFQTGHQFHALLERTFDDMDQANVWEMNHCRCIVESGKITIGSVPIYGERQILARRSFGHVLGPVAVMYELDFDKKTRTELQLAWQHYLIARQLNDDMHDWVEDFCVGHISFVVASLLQRLNISSGTYEIERLLPEMKKVFWEDEMIHINEYLLGHIGQSRQAFLSSDAIKRDGVVFGLLDRLESSAIEAVAQYEQMHQFVQAFKDEYPVKQVEM
jgi:hypothetical protein